MKIYAKPSHELTSSSIDFKVRAYILFSSETSNEIDANNLTSVEEFKYFIQNSKINKAIKEVLLIPILKAGKDLSEPSSYKSFSLISCFLQNI